MRAASRTLRNTRSAGSLTTGAGIGLAVSGAPEDKHKIGKQNDDKMVRGLTETPRGCILCDQCGSRKTRQINPVVLSFRENVQAQFVCFVSIWYKKQFVCSVAPEAFQKKTKSPCIQTEISSGFIRTRHHR